MSSLIVVMVTIVIVPAENSVPVCVLSLQGRLFSPVTVHRCFCGGLCPCLFPLTTRWAVVSSLIRVPVCCCCFCRGLCPVCVQGGPLCPLLFLFCNCYCSCCGECPILCSLITRWAAMSSHVLVPV